MVPVLPRIVPLLTATLVSTVSLAGCTAEEFASYEGEFKTWAEAWEERDDHDDQASGDDHDSAETSSGDEADGHHHTHRHSVRHTHVTERYQDADERFANHIDGEEDARRTITISPRDDDLRVKLSYVLDGETTFRLRNPAGITVALEDFDGKKSLQEDGWYTVEDPLPGDWRLTIDIDGEGAYAIGFYHD